MKTLPINGKSAASNAYAAGEVCLLPESRLYRPRSGHPDWPRLLSEAVSLSHELMPRLDRPESRQQLRRRRRRSGVTAFENFIANRRLHRSGSELLRPLYFIWTLLRTCNFRCDYCDDHQGHKYPDLDNRGVLNTKQSLALLRIMRSRAPSVYFAGGEPTLRKDLPLLTRAARDLNYYPVTINTNASVIDRLLFKKTWKTWLADTDIIVVSLDALNLSELETTWHSPRPHDVLRNLLLLRELAGRMRVKLMVNTVIRPGHIHHARDVLDFANDLGLWFCPVPVNAGPRVDPRLFADPDYRALASLILDRKHRGYRIAGSMRLNERLLKGEPLNCRNTLKPHVDFNGELLWPCKASVNVKPIPIRVLDFEHLDDIYAFASRQRDPTGFQGSGPLQCGAACGWAQNYTTDAYAHGLQRPMALLKDIVGFMQTG